MSLRETLLGTEVESAVVAPAEAAPDEIVEAITRQLDVVEGSLIVLSQMVQLTLRQIGNIRAEVALFGQPVPTPAPYMDPDDCGHEDRLWVDTADGRQAVCATCQAAS